jgi:hypothetical protein
MGIIDRPSQRRILVSTNPLMAQTKAPNRPQRTRRRARWNLLVLAGLPLVVLHLGLLLERALHRETLDSFVVVRWALAVALLILLKRAGFELRSLQLPNVGIAAVLIFTLIHAPVAAPEPALPLAVTGLGLALSLAVVDRKGGTPAVGLVVHGLAPRPSFALGQGVSRETLKDRAPPASR